MTNDFYNYPYPSKRNVQVAKNGAVASSSPLAAQAGLEILKKGGNACDAAIAAAAMSTVTEPASNGIGGDAFAIVWMNGKLYGLNSSGKAPKALSIDALKKADIHEIPRFGFIPVTVPGTPSAWVALNKKFGRLSLLECLSPAIKVAKEGYALNVSMTEGINRSFEIYSKHLKEDYYTHWFDTFIPKRKPYQVGETLVLKHHAKTLELIGKTQGEAFYHGTLADQIDAFSKANGGYIRKEDLKNHRVEWVDPISVNYRGYDIWELPPNGQGITALIALGLLNELPKPKSFNTTMVHNQIEAIKIAFKDVFTHVSDPKTMVIDPKMLLSQKVLKEKAASIKRTAQNYQDIVPYKGGTIYLNTADSDGNMVSYIQSNYMGFGSGLVVPNTGIALQNRGHQFSMDENHPNALRPNVRPLHTIIPGFITKDKLPIGPFGIMGGFMQPQAHVQVLSQMIDLHQNIQSALDSPRWQWMKDNLIHVEPSFDKKIINALIKRGHEVKISPLIPSFGRGQIIVRNHELKCYYVATEPRTDGTIALY
ncbi:MAG: gamma-glutamyltransferase family protein [Candidatus Izemoplasmataceae bacterium]